ncbi:hypothetical protein KR222_010142 [Zaprionus bogoriensis]|nr:hypothetical protein KR222_010142 [Zaprionus bogoriensis]
MRYNLLTRAARALQQAHRSSNSSRSRGCLSLRAASTVVGGSSSARSPLSAQQSAESTEPLAADEEQQQQQLPAREPLVKNLFVGIADKELLGYPEVITREEMAALQNALLPLCNYFEAEPELEQATEQQTHSQLRQLGLYGLNVPAAYDGRGYKWSASLMASEPESRQTSLALGLHTHRVVVDLLSELGTPEQQQRYLPALASGELVASEAIYESTPPAEGFFQTQASYDSATGKWSLSGEKCPVLVTPDTRQQQLLLVLAQTQQGNLRSDLGVASSIFLVDTQQAGVRLGERQETFGCSEAHMRSVQFDQVQLDERQLLGLPHEGNRLSEALMRASRLRSTQLGIALAKQLLQQMTSYSVDTTQCGVQVNELELTKVQLSSSMCAVYAMESMLYLTAGLLDEFAGQDVTLECAIGKYYTLQQLHAIATQQLGLLGARSVQRGEPAERALRDATQLCVQGESLGSLSMFIALSGLQHAGQRLNEGIRRSRNPLYHPGHILGKFLSSNSVERPKTHMQLGEHLHPSLEPAAQCIEHSVARLHMAVELMFTRHGNAVVERQHEMQRLANIASNVYAMWASAARASRSYCIGLPLADHELLTATAICSQGRDDVARLSKEIVDGNYVNNDNNLLRLSKQVAKSRGYFAVHPLTFNF